MEMSNPYVDARAEWNSRFAELAKGKRNWQVMCICLTAICTVLACGFVVVAAQSRTVPYIVEVDRTGFAQAIRPAERERAGDEDLVRHYVAAFIRNARTVTYDPEAMKSVLDNAYGYARGAAIGYLNEYYQKNDPFLKAKDGSVGVELSSILPISGRSWQVRWREVSRNMDGLITGEKVFEGLVSVELERPETEGEVLRNPLGIYVVELGWTEAMQ